MQVESKDKIILKDSNGKSMTCDELQVFCHSYKKYFGLDERDFVFVLCENTVACAAFFCATIEAKVVPLLLNAAIDQDMLKRYIDLYRPGYIFKPKTTVIDDAHDIVKEYSNYELLKTGHSRFRLHKDLSFLLPTSGTTGNPKLVRHTYDNLSISTKNVARVFDIKNNEYAMLSLPMHFTQGLSVLCSSLYSGASVFLTDLPISSREFWNIMKDEEITSFSGVPYSFEILDKLRFYKMDLPALKVINQGGGRMPDELFSKLATYAADTGRKFYATYGASETTSRMSCLMPEFTLCKCGSIGIPLPDYEMWLADDNDEKITTHGTTGELIFKGGNVTMGYANAPEDLSKGDEWNGVYRTGDIAYSDEDGFYYIVGRISRFIKIFGHRVNLDETERLVKEEFEGEFACVGSDNELHVFTVDKKINEKDVRVFLKDKLKVNISAFKVVYIEEIPRKRNNKIDYSKLDHVLINQEGV